MKHCRKMKRRQRVRLGSMGRKRDTTRWCGYVSWADVNLIETKNEKKSMWSIYQQQMDYEDLK
jgi:hypothetical protein